MIRSLNIWVALGLVFTAMLGLPLPGLPLLAMPSAHAQDTKRVAIMSFTGPSASSVQAQVSGGLKGRSEVELVSASEVKSTAERLGNSLASAADFKEVGEALELSAFIQGAVAKKGRNLQASVRVRDASTGEVIHEETWSRRRSGLKTIKPTVWPALGPAISESSPAPKPKPKGKGKPKPVPVPVPIAEEELGPEEEEPLSSKQDEEEEKAKDEDEGTDEKEDEAKDSKRSAAAGDKSALHPALVASFGPRLMWRSLSYDGTTPLQSYTSTGEGSPSFNLALAAQYYPGAHFGNAWLSDLGLDIDLDFALGLKSNQQGIEHKTSAYEFGVGAIYRIPLGDFEPRIRLGYVKQVFDVEDTDPTVLPGLSYNALRIGIGSAINLVDWLSLDMSFAYLPVLSTGELDDEYDGVSSGAWEVGAGALMRFAEVYGARLALDYRHYKYDFSQVNAAELPKSGTDTYMRLTLAFVYHLPGVAKKK